MRDRDRSLPIDVWIADDHPIVRAGLRQIVSNAPSIRVVGESVDAYDLLDAGGAATADVLLLDATMPGPGVFELLSRLTEAWPGVGIVVLGDHAVEHVAFHMLQRGASGYLSKEQPPDQFVRAIEEVASGNHYVPPPLTESLLTSPQHRVSGVAPGTLSDREFQVFRMLGSARSIKDIAADLSLSPKTVSTYRTRICDKTGLRTSAQFIRYVIEGGLEIRAF